ncbi:MAG TPA: ATPase domain-containing protein [Thermoanaerobaculia bacterium]|jgi:circadian clock protein KaiC
MNVESDGVASTGITGLDEILGGGFPKHHVYLLQGDPGAGKTTLSLQFLLEGARKGEKGLYITLSESRKELHAVARSHGWSLDDITIFEQLVGEEMLTEDEDLTLFNASEVELGETVNNLLREVERTKPKRVVLDSLSEIRLLSQSSLRYRKQILALKDFFARRSITGLFLDDRTAERNDLQLHSVPHGVVVLERLAPLYGSPRRRLEVVKVRGVNFRGGYHDFSILTGGIRVFPRPLPATHHSDSVKEQAGSGIAEIDTLTGGGLRRGNSTLIMGPAGTGKSTLATQYAIAAADRGERAAMFIFDESLGTLVLRSEDLGMPLRKHVEEGRVSVQQIDPAELGAGEFTQRVRQAVEEDGCSVVIIDSLNGYLNAIPEERFLTLHLHDLLSFLGERGVATIVVMAQHGFIGSGMHSTVDVSYLADCVILLRYYEADAEIKKAISVLKKRSGAHEKSIRDYDMGPEGIRVGPPLKQFRGLLTGTPVAIDGAHEPYGSTLRK